MKQKAKNNKRLFSLIIILILLIFFSTAKNTSSSSELVVVEDDISDIQIEVPIYKAEDIAQAIITTETGGSFKCHLSGASGEKSCFQFMPSTFRGYAKEVLGYVPELTDENAEKVALLKIEKWLEEDLEPSEIFLIWNTGRNRKCSSGYNSAGTYYNSCEYVKRSLNNLEEIINK